MLKPQKTEIIFTDVMVDGIPSVEITYKMEEPDAGDLSEPTPAMWLGLYVSSEFKSGRLMTKVEEWVASLAQPESKTGE